MSQLNRYHFLFVIWVVHSLLVFAYYHYHHLKKWLLTPNTFDFIREILSACLGR